MNKMSKPKEEKTMDIIEVIPSEPTEKIEPILFKKDHFKKFLGYCYICNQNVYRPYDEIHTSTVKHKSLVNTLYEKYYRQTEDPNAPPRELKIFLADEDGEWF